ncbi:MAG TPA: hypothetical protein VFW37_11940 [Alphaproteobacteria bacterium]|nr:hypothetical protein [Alphaproteobacteria bacterium]HEX4891063.1 hypothetical protein [Alphaproteobacteria bacterium]
MSFNFFKKATTAKMTETTPALQRVVPLAQARKTRLGRKTQVMALAAHIGQAGQKSRIGLPHWGG